MNKKISSEKGRAKKESLLRKVISNLFLQLKINDPRFKDLFINRVKLSPDKSILHIFFYTHEGEKKFNETLPILLLYKPSLRKSLAQLIKSRYTPDIIFKYDKHFEKQCKIETLLDQLKGEEKL